MGFKLVNVYKILVEFDSLFRVSSLASGSLYFLNGGQCLSTKGVASKVPLGWLRM